MSIKHVENYEKEQIEEITKKRSQENKTLPDFNTGDTIKAYLKITEGERTRTQNFEGIVIAINKKGLQSNFTVRKISQGIGVERIIGLHCPNLEKIEIIRKGKVNQSKIYYQRERSGKSARVKEKKFIKDQ
jgi:large subunit ribosomal protein L19